MVMSMEHRTTVLLLRVVICYGPNACHSFNVAFDHFSIRLPRRPIAGVVFCTIAFTVYKDDSWRYGRGN